MGGFNWQILILLVLAIVVFWRLMSEFGKRDGYEPERKLSGAPQKAANEYDDLVAEMDDVEPQFQDAISKARAVEPSFHVTTFLGGAKSAYEMILMAYLNGDMESVRPYVDADVYAGFEEAIKTRLDAGHVIHAEFVGVKDVKLVAAEFDEKSGELELGVEFLGQLSQEIVDAKGKVIEGDKNKVETEQDTWFFARKMGVDDPNWLLVATDG